MKLKKNQTSQFLFFVPIMFLWCLSFLKPAYQVPAFSTRKKKNRHYHPQKHEIAILTWFSLSEEVLSLDIVKTRNSGVLWDPRAKGWGEWFHSQNLKKIITGEWQHHNASHCTDVILFSCTETTRQSVVFYSWCLWCQTCLDNTETSFFVFEIDQT